MAKNKFISIKTSNELLEYLKGEWHKSYKIYYSNFGIVKEILKNKKLLLRSTEYNDKVDERNINDSSDGYKKFVLCFNYSMSESIAMWRIYGFKKCSCMIKFPSSTIKDIIENANQFELGIFQRGKFIKANTQLNKSDVELFKADVIYFNEKNDDMVYLKHKYGYIKEIHKDILSKCMFLAKDYGWSFEDETRIVCRINKKLIKDNKINAVRINISDEIIEHIKNNIVINPSNCNLFLKGIPVKQSDFFGKIDFNDEIHSSNKDI